MFTDPDRQRRFYAVSPFEDVAETKKGSAIPNMYGRVKRRAQQSAGFPVTMAIARVIRAYPEPVMASFLLLVASAFFASQVFGSVSTQGQLATPVISIQYPGERYAEPIRYGSEPLLARPDFFQETRRTFIREKATFIEADLASMRLSYYQEGEMVLQFPIQAKGQAGSWWETPAGLYKVQAKRPNHSSSFGQVNLPWSLPFQGNFFIHGWPKYFDGTPVESSYSGGYIRLSNEDAQALFTAVEVSTPVLVHEPREMSRSFQYEPSIPDMDAPHYLLADLESSVVLASSELSQPAPIASVTKLMTALVATEYISLDRRVTVTQPSLIQSLIPRLAQRRDVSMYSLLQLLLMESSNEAAELIATQTGRDVFIDRMNQKAAAIGMRDTTFVDPSGLGSGNVSTLSDLMRLAEYIYYNRSFILELTNNQYVPTAYEADAFGELRNFNAVANIQDIFAGKVGETTAAGQTSLTLHQINVRGEDRTILIVVLGSENRAVDVSQLHQYFYDRFVR